MSKKPTYYEGSFVTTYFTEDGGKTGTVNSFLGADPADHENIFRDVFSEPYRIGGQTFGEFFLADLTIRANNTARKNEQVRSCKSEDTAGLVDHIKKTISAQLGPWAKRHPTADFAGVEKVL